MPYSISLESTLNRLRQRGVSIQSAIDVGAHHGEWFNTFKKVFPTSQILSVEANPSAFSVLQRSNPNSINACFSNTKGKKTFFLPNSQFSNLDTGASLYKENLPYYQNAQTLEVDTSTLDDLKQQFDYIKLDVQGAELDVLRGAERTLQTALFIQLEVSILQYNEAAPLAAEVIAYLHTQGFCLLDITEIMILKDKLNQLDLIFVSKTHSELLKI